MIGRKIEESGEERQEVGESVVSSGEKLDTTPTIKQHKSPCIF